MSMLRYSHLYKINLKGYKGNYNHQIKYLHIYYLYYNPAVESGGLRMLRLARKSNHQKVFGKALSKDICDLKP